MNFQSPINEAIFNHWKALFKDGKLPSRADISPHEMIGFLSHVILIDVLYEPELDFRYRLVGTYHRSYWNSDKTGKCVRTTAQQGPGSKVWAGYERTALTKQPTTTLAPYVGPKNDIYETEDIVLPLSADGETVDMLFVGLDYIPRAKTLSV